MKSVDSAPARNRGRGRHRRQKGDVVLNAGDIEPVERMAQPVDRDVAVGTVGD